jgi:hypothetical protein
MKGLQACRCFLAQIIRRMKPQFENDADYLCALSGFWVAFLKTAGCRISDTSTLSLYQMVECLAKAQPALAADVLFFMTELLEQRARAIGVVVDSAPPPES